MPSPRGGRVFSTTHEGAKREIARATHADEAHDRTHARTQKQHARMHARTAGLCLLVGAALLAVSSVSAREVDHIMDEIKSAISSGIAESADSTGAMINAVRNSGRELGALGKLGSRLDFSTNRPYPWWALPQATYEGDLPKWSRPALNERINQAAADANTRLQEAYENYEREYCSDYGPVVPSEWQPAKFDGGGCKLTIELGGCYVYPVDGPDKKLPVLFNVNCTTPKISVVKNKPKFESAYKSGTEYSFRSCRGKSVSLGQEKTNFLQFPGNQFVVPFMQLPARMPKRMSQWVGLGRFARK